MKVADIHDRIHSLAGERGLSPYELAKRSGMAVSSLYNMFERGTMPKIETLHKICSGMDITLSDFFIPFSKPRIGGYVSEGDELLMEANRHLTGANQKKLLAYAQGLIDAQGAIDDGSD